MNEALSVSWFITFVLFLVLGIIVGRINQDVRNLQSKYETLDKRLASSKFLFGDSGSSSRRLGSAVRRENFEGMTIKRCRGEKMREFFGFLNTLAQFVDQELAAARLSEVKQKINQLQILIGAKQQELQQRMEEDGKN